MTNKTIQEFRRMFDFKGQHIETIYGTVADLEAFILKVEKRARKAGRKQALTEAINIFDKYKDEPMTGNVVNLELKGLRGDYGL